jgi:hypothetical protein
MEVCMDDIVFDEATDLFKRLDALLAENLDLLRRVDGLEDRIETLESELPPLIVRGAPWE